MAKPTLKKVLKIILPLALGVFLMYYSIARMSSVERADMWDAIVTASPIPIAISLVLSILSHLSRAYRWNFMLVPMGYRPKVLNNFLAVMIGYFANTFVLRSGEVLRGVALSKAEGIPFEKTFGTIVSERVADLVMLLLVIGLGILLQTDEAYTYLSTKINPLTSVLTLGGLIIAGIIGLRILKLSNHPFVVKVRNFGLGVLEGIKSILHMKKNAAFVFHTIFIWAMYFSMFLVITYCVPSLLDAPLSVSLIAFIVGAFAMSATNSGMGIYPLAMGATFAYFGYEGGELFGWIIWGSQTIFNIIFGGACALFMPWYNRTQKIV